MLSSSGPNSPSTPNCFSLNLEATGPLGNSVIAVCQYRVTFEGGADFC
jgi:hypothetical protein